MLLNNLNICNYSFNQKYVKKHLRNLTSKVNQTDFAYFVSFLSILANKFWLRQIPLGSLRFFKPWLKKKYYFAFKTRVRIAKQKMQNFAECIAGKGKFCSHNLLRKKKKTCGDREINIKGNKARGSIWNNFQYIFTLISSCAWWLTDWLNKITFAFRESTFQVCSQHTGNIVLCIQTCRRYHSCLPRQSQTKYTVWISDQQKNYQYHFEIARSAAKGDSIPQHSRAPVNQFI